MLYYYLYFENILQIDVLKKGLIMKKKICAAIVTVSVLITSVTAAADTGIITAGVLNVRCAPASTVIGHLSRGQNVSILGYSNDWCQVQYGDSIGYVHGAYVDIQPETVPAAEPAPEAPAPTAGENILAYAKNFLGVPYVYGGSTPSGFDCSGFVKYVYAYFGISLPRTSYGQRNAGYAVSTSNLQLGDILVFDGGGHVGIYAGNNTYIHAPRSGRTVSIDPINRSITAARRIF